MTPSRSIRHATLTLACAALSLVPVAAQAGQGLSLAWFHCYSEGTGTHNAVFACNTNAGVHSLVGSFELANDMANVIGTEIVLNLAADAPALPDWWQFKNTGTCRLAALSAAFANPGSLACPDWSAGLMIGGLGAYCTASVGCPTSPSANAAIIKLINAVAPNDATPLLGGQTYYDFTINISNIKTVGDGSCNGCTVPVCIVLNSINVVAKDNVEHRFLSGAASPVSNFVTWQGGGNPVGGGTIGCPAATATRTSSWGSVKSLYR